MAAEAENFMTGASELEKARKLRRRGMAPLRPGGVYYGIAAYGYPLGAITGVQNPWNTQPPAEGGGTPTEALGPQWGGGETTGGEGGGGVQ